MLAVGGSCGFFRLFRGFRSRLLQNQRLLGNLGQSWEDVVADTANRSALFLWPGWAGYGFSSGGQLMGSWWNTG